MNWFQYVPDSLSGYPAIDAGMILVVAMLVAIYLPTMQGHGGR